MSLDYLKIFYASSTVFASEIVVAQLRSGGSAFHSVSFLSKYSKKGFWIKGNTLALVYLIRTVRNAFLPRKKKMIHKPIPYFYVSVRTIAGMVLMLAGASKIWPMQGMPLFSGLVLPSWMVLLIGVAEIILGWLCLLFFASRGLCLLTVGVYFVFIVVLSVKLALGQTRCQCLGGTAMFVNWMLLLDSSIVFFSLYFRREWGLSLIKSSGTVFEQVNNLRWVVPFLLVASILCFGSVSGATSFLSGNRLVVDSASKFAGTVQYDKSIDVSFVLKNFSMATVNVIGAASSCSCLGVVDLPILIGPGESKLIRVRLFSRKKGEIQEESVDLIFDDSSSRQKLFASAYFQSNPE